ncbi:MAG: NRDE family protein [Pseudomonadales bacterium]|nr:NRDE family protein [Pseudomonadales bacterium]
MCTLTWLKDESGYQVLFNRDELKSRQRALPPQLHRQGPVTYIAPTDPDAGGSWISTNQFGITLCLLNHYQAPIPMAQENWISRGLLIKDLADKSTTQAILSHLAQRGLSQYKPFDLLIFSLRQLPLQISWDGLNLNKKTNPDMPLTSSSFNTTSVIRNRISQLTSTPPSSVKLLLDYHLGHLPEKGPYSVCMHRDDASTVSFSHIQVNNVSALFHYWDGPPCEALSSAPTSIKLEQEVPRPSEIIQSGRG